MSIAFTNVPEAGQDSHLTIMLPRAGLTITGLGALRDQSGASSHPQSSQRYEKDGPDQCPSAIAEADIATQPPVGRAEGSRRTRSNKRLMGDSTRRGRKSRRNRVSRVNNLRSRGGQTPPRKKHKAGSRAFYSKSRLPYIDASPRDLGLIGENEQQRIDNTNNANNRDDWSYKEAFIRNLGLIDAEEQKQLRGARVAIVGMGGVGGVHLATLARLGIGRFTIADPDAFETANFNRQYGATVPNLGRGKAQVMAKQAKEINPELDLQVFDEAITQENVARFLSGVDVLVDGIDFFGIDARRAVFREARKQGIWAVTAGPIGFSTACLCFDPNGMTFDRYFDLDDQMDDLDQLIAFAVGLTPGATHAGYLKLSNVDHKAATGPSASLACELAAGVAAAETLKILLKRGPIQPAPWHLQFDAYRRLLRKGRLRWGNRHPWRRVKRYVLRRRILQLVGTT